jgi:methionyl-tRNA formyltransferase
MSVVFFGSPQFAVPSLKSLLEAGEKIEAVVTQTDKPAGRSREPVPPPIKEFALERGLRVMQPASMKDETFLGELEAIKPEFIVVVAYRSAGEPARLAASEIQGRISHSVGGDKRRERDRPYHHDDNSWP